MCRSMVDIQSATAEIRRGKKEERKKETGQKYNVRICYAGRPPAIITNGYSHFQDWRFQVQLLNFYILETRLYILLQLVQFVLNK